MGFYLNVNIAYFGEAIYRRILISVHNLRWGHNILIFPRKNVQGVEFADFRWESLVQKYFCKLQYATAI